MSVGLIKKRKKASNYRARRAMWGRLFILPWAFGTLFFFVIPLAKSFYYAFNKMAITQSGIKLNFVGLDNFVYLFTQDANFLRNLTESILQMIYRVPVIVILSLIIAIVLKDSFRGRTLARAVFFFPVMIASGVVITNLREQVFMGAVNLSEQQQAFMFSVPSFEALATDFQLPASVMSYVSGIVECFFDIMWKSGVQIILLLSAVTHIPPSSYEAAEIEGANAWEKLWKLTFPLISPTILVVVIYTIIDSFTDYSNQVMGMISSYFEKGQYEYSTTIGLVYFLVVLLIVGLINHFFSKRVFYSTK